MSEDTEHDKWWYLYFKIGFIHIFSSNIFFLLFYIHVIKKKQNVGFLLVSMYKQKQMVEEKQLNTNNPSLYNKVNTLRRSKTSIVE